MAFYNFHMICRMLLALELDLKTIATYYGLICMFCLPISLVAIVFIYRSRPDIVKSLDTAVDKLFGDQPAKPNDETEPAKEEETATPQAEPAKDTKEEIEDYGIPVLVLYVGDRYKCVMSNKNRKDVGGTDFRWAVEDAFIGNMTETGGIFIAKHVGETYIKSLAADIPIYLVEVKPVHTDWFATLLMKDVLEAEDISNIKVRNIEKKIVNLETERKIIEYQMDGYSLSYEYGKDDAVRRALCVLPDNQETRNGIAEKITEFMEPVNIQVKDAVGASYWYHETVEGKDGFVDFVAFMKASVSGRLYFGIGECWRYGSTVDEIIGNHLMIIRSFRALIDKKDYPASVGTGLKAEPTEEEAAGRKEIEAANNAGKEESSKIGKPAKDESGEKKPAAGTSGATPVKAEDNVGADPARDETPEPEGREEEDESDSDGFGDMEDESVDGGPDIDQVDNFEEEDHDMKDIGHSDE